jgi:hypothetical protein
MRVVKLDCRRSAVFPVTVGRRSFVYSCFLSFLSLFFFFLPRTYLLTGGLKNFMDSDWDFFQGLFKKEN